MISDQRFLPETALKGVELWDGGQARRSWCVFLQLTVWLASLVTLLPFDTLSLCRSLRFPSRCTFPGLCGSHPPLSRLLEASPVVSRYHGLPFISHRRPPRNHQPLAHRALSPHHERPLWHCRGQPVQGVLRAWHPGHRRGEGVQPHPPGISPAGTCYTIWLQLPPDFCVR